ncbi:hypothetical protein FRB99_000386 [Tulasnella sp. 403]|nr:hypothetical protein FRB99_000386 [Tulasnella sp. 403]
MFFSAELLIKKESGLGLLWLAATIGAKASFRKLNKRSILSADIEKLCDMIAEPDEPLALRLSSNLLVGVARVHRAQHEIFYNDVMTCFTTLKRAFVDLVADNQLTGPVVMRRDQITLEDAPFSLEFDLLDAVRSPPTSFHKANAYVSMKNWINATPRPATPTEGEPNRTQEPPRDVGHEQPSQTSSARKRLHLLDDTYPSLTDFSGPSDDPFRDEDEQLFGGDEMDLQLDLDLDIDMGVQAGLAGADDPNVGMAGIPESVLPIDDGPPTGLDQADHRVRASSMSSDVQPRLGTNDRAGKIQSRDATEDPEIGDPLRGAPSTFEGSQFLDDGWGDARRPWYEDDALDANDVAAPLNPPSKPSNSRPRRKHALWDDNIELTNDELQAMRDGYESRMMQEGNEAKSKKRRYDAANLVNSLMNAPFLGALDKEMTTWWNEILVSRYEDFSSRGRVQIDDGFAVPAPPKKRQKRGSRHNDSPMHDSQVANEEQEQDTIGQGSDGGHMAGFLVDDIDFAAMMQDDNQVGQPASSVEPEQGRRGSSRPASSAMGSHLEGRNRGGSQRSSLFPWTKDAQDKGPAESSSNFGASYGGFAAPSSSVQGGIRASSAFPEGMDANSVFNIGNEDMPAPSPIPEPTGGDDDTQRTDMSLLTLERTLEAQSFQFLTHLNANVDPVARFTAFNALLDPKSISRTVAATGFYHVLGKYFIF